MTILPESNYLKHKVWLAGQGLQLVIEGMKELYRYVTALVATPFPRSGCIFPTPVLFTTADRQATIIVEAFFVESIDVLVGDVQEVTNARIVLPR